MIEIFISYSHEDEQFLDNNLKPVLDELLSEEVSEYFYDRKIRPDSGLFDTIDYHIDSCNIAIALISQHFYNSESCKKEKDRLLKRKKEEGLFFLPIILSECEWKNDESIKKNLLLNTDAKELSLMRREDLSCEMEKIKARIRLISEDIEIIRSMSFSDSHKEFLEDMDVLKTSHRLRSSLALSEMYVSPIIRRFSNNDYSPKDIDSSSLYSDSLDYRYVFISGDSVSGKTSILKKLLIDSKAKQFIPLFFSSSDSFDGHILNILCKKLIQQYSVEQSEKEISRLIQDNKERIIVFIDDFHKIKDPLKLFRKLGIISKIILSVDLLYNLDYELLSVEADCVSYTIKELSPQKRNELIKKWLYLDNDIKTYDESHFIKEIEKKTALVEAITSKTIKGGIMPAYPFLVLSILGNTETLNRPLDQRITSYGYCYEALIIIAFQKCGLVAEDEVGGAISFLSHFAFFLYQKGQREVSQEEFFDFLEDYEKKISLPYEKEKFERRLLASRLLVCTSLGNYRFNYKYMFYYFVAKYFSENGEDSLSEIRNMCNEIYKDENAYIVIFFSHNVKSKAFLDIILGVANSISPLSIPASLSKKEMSFFDDSYQLLLNTALPERNHNYKKDRAKSLQSIKEDDYVNYYQEELEINDNELVLNFRKSVKITETIGIIVKNRYSSVDRATILNLIRSAINLNLRGISGYFSILKDADNQNAIIHYLSDLLKQKIEKEKGSYEDASSDEIVKNVKTLFWGFNFLFIYLVLFKTIQSLGSEKLIKFFSELTKSEDTPANNVILEGVKIMYGKNIDKNSLARCINSKEYSSEAKTVLQIMITDYCRLNPIDYSELQELSAKMKIQIKKLH